MYTTIFAKTISTIHKKYRQQSQIPSYNYSLELYRNKICIAVYIVLNKLPAKLKQSLSLQQILKRKPRRYLSRMVLYSYWSFG